jgi:hypothetical protein
MARSIISGSDIGESAFPPYPQAKATEVYLKRISSSKPWSIEYFQLEPNAARSPIVGVACFGVVDRLLSSFSILTEYVIKSLSQEEFKNLTRLIFPSLKYGSPSGSTVFCIVYNTP